MEWQVSLSIILVALMIILFSGLPVAFGFLTLNIICLFALKGKLGLVLLSSGMWTSLASFTMVPLPLFLLMGAVLFESGVTSHLFSRNPPRLKQYTCEGCLSGGSQESGIQAGISLKRFNLRIF